MNDLYLCEGLQFVSSLVSYNFNLLQRMLNALILLMLCSSVVNCYDPTDKKLDQVLPAPGDFDPFYSQSESVGAARAPHDHGSFYGHRNSALVQVRNAPAYGFRFGGSSRRFNYN